jgi:hypothetical protein
VAPFDAGSWDLDSLVHRFRCYSTLAEDTVKPERDIGFATVLVCLLQTGIWVATVYLAALVVPDYNRFPDSETAILDISRLIGGSWMLGLLVFVLLVAGLASALTGKAGASRLLFGIGRARWHHSLGNFRVCAPALLNPDEKHLSDGNRFIDWALVMRIAGVEGPYDMYVFHQAFGIPAVLCGPRGGIHIGR